MFEQELEMEKKEGSSYGPLVVVILLVGLFIGGIGVVIYQSNIAIKPSEANTAIETLLKKNMPVTVTFHTGKVSYKNTDIPTDAQYKLLEKAGYLKITGTKDFAANVELTPAGKSFLASMPEVKPVSEKDGTTGYTLPLATRKLVAITKIAKLGTRKFEVDYTWQWVPTKAGDLFDVAGAVAQSLPVYERSSLIDRHGGAYYHAQPDTVAIALVKSDEGWVPFK